MTRFFTIYHQDKMVGLMELDASPEIVDGLLRGVGVIGQANEVSREEYEWRRKNQEMRDYELGHIETQNDTKGEGE